MQLASAKQMVTIIQEGNVCHTALIAIRNGESTFSRITTSAHEKWTWAAEEQEQSDKGQEMVVAAEMGFLEKGGQCSGSRGDHRSAQIMPLCYMRWEARRGLLVMRPGFSSSHKTFRIQVRWPFGLHRGKNQGSWRRGKSI